MNEDKVIPSGRCVRLLQILLRETDENHKLTGPVLIQRLTAEGYHTSEETLRTDLKALNALGYTYVSSRGGKDPGYFADCRPFTPAELKLLLDAVQATGFVPEQKTRDLKKKLASLASLWEAKGLKKSEVLFNTRKHSNSQIYYIVDACENALRSRTQLRFKYYDLDFRCEHCYRYDKETITVEPYALVCFEDNYYLHALRTDIADEAEALRIYRLDRMEKAEKLSAPISQRAIARVEKPAEYTRSAFKMFNGEEVTVTLRFPKELCGPVFDKFGEKISIKQLSEDQGELTETVRISGTFFGWVDQFEGKMQIVAPESVCRQHREHLQKLLERY